MGIREFKLSSDKRKRFSFEKIRIVAISDTHTQHSDVIIPKGDILLFCGDMCGRGSLPEVFSFNKWLQKLEPEFKKIVVIAGNHDWALYRSHERVLAKEMLLTGLSKTSYLENESTTFMGLNIYGSPYTPKYCGWAFMKEREDIKKTWDLIPQDTDILLTHGPELGILDHSEIQHIYVGCKELGIKIKNDLDIFLHCFGHIHESYGIDYAEKNVSVNCSICTLQYKPINPPIVLDIVLIDDYLYIIREAK